MPRNSQVQTSLAMVLWLSIPCTIVANNLQVSQATLVDADPNDGIAQVQFDISWENSWRVSTAPNNWDAAWVFVKFKAGSLDPVHTGVTTAGNVLTVASTSGLRPGMPVTVLAGTGLLQIGTVISSIPTATTITLNYFPFVPLDGATVRFDRIWEHAHLGITASHVAPAGTTITVGCVTAGIVHSATNPGVGVFVHRSVDGSGPFTAQGCLLQWLHGTQGIGIGTTVELCVHAVEMVLVPTGSYYLGGTGTWAFRSGTGGSTPRLITSENHLNYASTFNVTLSYGGAGNGNDFGSGFPKGYEGFYCMKYELSQSEYVDYLNKLTRVQQAAMVATNIAPGVMAVTNRFVMTNTAAMVNRSAIRSPGTIDPAMPITFVCDADADGTGNETDDGGWTSANYINAPNILAYLDWSGLRPMSEMEFEKACRGPAMPIAGDYAWGSTSIVLPTSQSGVHSANETVDDPSNTSHSSLAPNGGPFRGGMFAESGASRVTAGASYYGIMDLSGNLAEYTISAGYLSLLFHRFSHGDGLLTELGAHNAPTWPVDGMYGFAPRGGSWSSSAFQQRVSDRASMAGFSATRFADRGFRGVRRVAP